MFIRTIRKCNIWNPVTIYLIWSGKWTISGCPVKAGSLQIRPDFSQFPFNPPQVMGRMKLNWRKRKPKNNPQAIFSNSRILALKNSGITTPDFCMQNCYEEKNRTYTYVYNNYSFFWNTKDAPCLLGKGQSKMPQTEADLSAPCMVFNTAHSSY